MVTGKIMREFEPRSKYVRFVRFSTSEGSVTIELKGASNLVSLFSVNISGARIDPPTQ